MDIFYFVIHETILAQQSVSHALFHHKMSKDDNSISASTTTIPICVFIVAINMWKMRNTEYMHFNLITLTCIACILFDGFIHYMPHNCSWNSQVNSFLLFNIIYSYFLFVFIYYIYIDLYIVVCACVMCQKCKWKNDIYYRDASAIDVVPFLCVKNKHWHELMAIFNVCTWHCIMHMSALLLSCVKF